MMEFQIPMELSGIEPDCFPACKAGDHPLQSQTLDIIKLPDAGLNYLLLTVLSIKCQVKESNLLLRIFSPARATVSAYLTSQIVKL